MTDQIADPGRQLTLAWWEIFRNQRLTVRNVIITAMEGGAATAELRAALATIAPSNYPGAFSPHKLGRWLVRHAQVTVPIDDATAYRFMNRGTEYHAQVWQLLPVDLSDAEVVSSEFLSAVA